MSCFELICCVVRYGDATKTINIARKYGIKGGSVHLGRGTVSNHLLEVLGITEIRKEFITMIIEKELASEAMLGIGREMELHKDHHGIAFSHSLSIFACGKDFSYDEKNDIEGKKIMYKAIYTIVERGKAEDVIDAAVLAGARGGTILNARGAGKNEVRKFFSVDVEPEKEMVFILAKTEIKDAIVESIISHLGINKEDGNGVIFVLDINEAYGLKHE